MGVSTWATAAGTGSAGPPADAADVGRARRGQYLLAGVTDDNRLVFGRFGNDHSPQLSESALESAPQQIVLTPDGRQLYLLAGNRLARYQINDTQLQLKETRTLGEHSPYRLTALPGGSALLIAAADGSVREWFDVKEPALATDAGAAFQTQCRTARFAGGRALSPGIRYPAARWRFLAVFQHSAAAVAQRQAEQWRSTVGVRPKWRRPAAGNGAGLAALCD